MEKLTCQLPVLFWARKAKVLSAFLEHQKTDLLKILPAQYVRGEGVIDNIGIWAQELGGERILMIAQKEALEVTEEAAVKSLHRKNLTVDTELFQGECSDKQIDVRGGII